MDHRRVGWLGVTATLAASHQPLAVPGGLMAAEIAEQPAVLAGLLARAPEIGEVAAALARRPRGSCCSPRGAPATTPPCTPSTSSRSRAGCPSGWSRRPR